MSCGNNQNFGQCSQPTKAPTCYPTANNFAPSTPGSNQSQANPAPTYNISVPPVSFMQPPTQLGLSLYQQYIAANPN